MIYTLYMSFLERLCCTLNSKGIKYAIVGGHAVALHGAVRGTVDVDFVIAWSHQALSNVEACLNSIGLVSRLPISADDVFYFRDEYINARNLIAWNFYNPQNLTEQVDVIISYDLSIRSIDNMVVGDTAVPVLKLNRLIDMKRESAREQDLFDIDALERLKK